jgi:hypothetical protein
VVGVELGAAVVLVAGTEVASAVGVNVAPVAVVVRVMGLPPSTGYGSPGTNSKVVFCVYANCCSNVCVAFYWQD